MVNIFYTILSYLLGSVNFSYLIGKLKGLEIDKFGDENLGATNLYYAALEKYGKQKAFLLFFMGGLLDIFKGLLPVLLFQNPIYGFFAILGHCFSIFSIIKTKKIPSGVGLASTIGYLLAIPKGIYLLLIAGILFLFYLAIFGKNIFKIERGHSFYPFAAFLAVIIFYIFINSDNSLFYINILIVTITSIARVLRLKIVFEKFCVKS